MEPLSAYRYPLRSLAPDYARGVIGAAVSGACLALIPTGSAMSFVFAGLTALFGLFTIRTALRQQTRVELTERGLSVGPGRRDPLAWDELEQVALRYYSTRRARDRGWMTLTLSSRRRRIVLDSNLEGFEAIVARAAEAARRNGVALGETTRANLAALGVSGDGSATPQSWFSSGPQGSTRASPPRDRPADG